MSEYQRYNLTLRVVDPTARDKFRALSRPESFFEIRPNRSPGQRGAYRVEMTQSEYEAALEDAQNPESNLLVVEPDGLNQLHASGAPDDAQLAFVAAQNAQSLGLTGSGVIVGVPDSGLGAALRDGVFSGRIAASKTFIGTTAFQDNDGHGSNMASLAVPPNAKLAVARVADNDAATDAELSAGIYWLADEAHVNIISCSVGSTSDAQAKRDAFNHAVSKNILVFASAGNDGNSTPHYPAAYSGVLAISNYEVNTGQIDPQSSYGNHIFAATGGDPGHVLNPSGGLEATSSGGTSTATAVAAHVGAAFMTGGRSAGTVKNYLATKARKTGASPIYEGNGVLQLAAAENEVQQEKPYPQNLDNSIPLPDGGILTEPVAGDSELPAGTTVYPTGTPTYVPNTIGLPEGGLYQQGNNSIDSGSTITPVPPDGAGDPDPGACG